MFRAGKGNLQAEACLACGNPELAGQRAAGADLCGPTATKPGSLARRVMPFSCSFVGRHRLADRALGAPPAVPVDYGGPDLLRCRRVPTGKAGPFPTAQALPAMVGLRALLRDLLRGEQRGGPSLPGADRRSVPRAHARHVSHHFAWRTDPRRQAVVQPEPDRARRRGCVPKRGAGLPAVCSARCRTSRRRNRNQERTCVHQRSAVGRSSCGLRRPPAAFRGDGRLWPRQGARKSLLPPGRQSPTLERQPDHGPDPCVRRARRGEMRLLAA